MELCLEEGTVLAENLEKENLEMLYFSIQMAAAELFTNETVFPVILDDIFHGKNQDKLMAVFRWLKKQPDRCCFLPIIRIWLTFFRKLLQ